MTKKMSPPRSSEPKQARPAEKSSRSARTATLLILFGLLTLATGAIWLFFNKPELEPLTVVFGGITALLTAVNSARVNRIWAIVLFVLGLGLFAWGMIRVFPSSKPATSTEEIFVLLERGSDAHSKSQYREALNYYQQALVIARQIGDRAGEGTTLNNIGGVYRAQGQYDQALLNHQQALVIAREIGNRAGEGAALTNIGLVYVSQGQYDQALSNYQQALVIAREIGDRTLETTILNSIERVGSVND